MKGLISNKMKLIFISFFIATLIVGNFGRLLGGGSKNVKAGGITTANDSETYAQIRKLVADGVNDISGSDSTSYRLVKITNASKQVVAGMKYIVTGIFQTTNPKIYYLLTVQIWSKPWKDFVQCKDH